MPYLQCKLHFGWVGDFTGMEIWVGFLVGLDQDALEFWLDLAGLGCRIGWVWRFSWDWRLGWARDLGSLEIWLDRVGLGC